MGVATLLALLVFQFHQLKLNENSPYLTDKGGCNNVVAKIFYQECIRKTCEIAKRAPKHPRNTYRL